MKKYVVLAVLIVLAIVGVYFYSRKPLPTPMTDVIPDASTTPAASLLSIRSSAFADGESIPMKYTCEGDSINPPLTIDGVPGDAQSLVLIVDDPDVPKQLKPGGLFVHWVLFNIPATTTDIAEGMPVGTPGNNGAGKMAYAGPCPPPQYEPREHRYFFKVYALDTELPLNAGASKEDVEAAMDGHILAQGTLIGRYAKQGQ